MPSAMRDLDSVDDEEFALFTAHVKDLASDLRQAHPLPFSSPLTFFSDAGPIRIIFRLMEHDLVVIRVTAVP